MDLFDQLGKARYCSKFIHWSGYWYMQIAKDDKVKITCMIKYRAFEFLMMPFDNQFSNHILHSNELIIQRVFWQVWSFVLMILSFTIKLSKSILSTFKQYSKFYGRMLCLLKKKALFYANKNSIIRTPRWWRIDSYVQVKDTSYDGMIGWETLGRYHKRSEK